MQMNGSAKLSAPRCTAYTGPNIPVSSYSGAFSNGDSFLTAAAAVEDTTLTMESEVGFPASGTLIIGYGSSNQEEVSYTTPEGIVLGSGLLKSHDVNERVVVKPTVSLMPGSVIIKYDGSLVATDNGEGLIINIQEPVVSSGTVDYSTGLVRLVLSNADEIINVTGDVLSDAPDAEGALASGASSHKSYQQYAFTRNDVPGSATVSNLGDSVVGFFFEVSRNGGKSFTSFGYGKSAGILGTMNRKTVTLPSGGDMVVRFRAGSGSTSTTSELEGLSSDPERRIIEPRVVTVDTTTILNNG